MLNFDKPRGDNLILKKLDSVEQYNNLTREVRKECRRPYSNLYYTAEQIQRYIDLGRAFFYNAEGGVIFLFDEENFYKVGLYLNGERQFDFPSVDKKLLIRNVYKEGKKEAVLANIENKLIEIGFVKQATTAQVVAQVPRVYEKSRNVERYVSKMEKNGFYCGTVDETQMFEAEQMLLDSKIIKDYHIDYRTESEKNTIPGTYMGIWNKDGKLCAVSIVPIINGIAHGIGIAVREEYKMCGLAPILTYYRFQWLQEHSVELIQAWLLLSNEKSILYHSSLGYIITDKRADEWIKEY